ncbi:hypothetical protein SELMODRAFT_427581 [Selaginella moellendorffii]|uniref:Uncharacterized protein n=1 Tax=Selaginella moellendorffii TaxID=88036 RepID=D8T022_SELML|nr:hypothetical protein SELMODRAFT_427581 [Selaginella moellendorffii]
MHVNYKLLVQRHYQFIKRVHSGLTQCATGSNMLVLLGVQEAKGFQGCFMLEVRALGIVMTAQVLLMFGIRSGNSDLLVFFSNGSNLNAINNNDHPEILSRGWATSRFLIYFGKKEETALSATLRKRLQIGCSLIFSRAVVISFCMFYLANYL